MSILFVVCNLLASAFAIFLWLIVEFYEIRKYERFNFFGLIFVLAVSLIPIFNFCSIFLALVKICELANLQRKIEKIVVDALRRKDNNKSIHS